ncbi:MAG: hypothetical protein B7Z66_03375 [Chromatiales bacterium 21-64-14]|nr:MAG: hypothetical protein B7Z66_03375 [Chromatiales bacterium 21-64-14]HQU15820.1 hypothetical protein [Gammaproteobacteria bacterium]
MVTGALLLFVVAALLGGVLAGQALRDRLPSTGLALVHGAVAIAGLVLLGMVVSGAADTMLLNDVLLLFGLTAAGGLLLFSFHLRRRNLPGPFILLHGAVAVISIAVLAVGYYGAR